MSGEPPEDPPSKKPDDPSFNTPTESSKRIDKEKVKSPEPRSTKKYIQLIEQISKQSKKKGDRKDLDVDNQPFEVKKKVEIKRPEEEELKRKLSALSSKLEKLKSETKSVFHETSSKISALEKSFKGQIPPPLPPFPDKISSLKGSSIKLSKENIFPKVQTFVSMFFSKILSSRKNLRLSGIRSPEDPKMSAPGRPMKFPYTYSAKIAQFPLKFYVKNNWMWKYYFIAVAVSFPVFYKIGRLSNSPENVKKWEEIRKRDFTPGHH